MARSSSGGDWILPAYVNAPNSRILVSQSAGSPCRNWANSVSTWVDGCCMVIAPELRPGGKTIQLSINGVNFQIDKTGLRQRVGANGGMPPLVQHGRRGEILPMERQTERPHRQFHPDRFHAVSSRR